MRMLFRECLETLAAGVLGLDETLHISFMNPAAEALLQGSEQRLRGLPSDHLFAEPGAWRDTVHEARSGGHRVVRRSLALVLHSGHNIVLDVVVTPREEPSPELTLVAELYPVDQLVRINTEENRRKDQETSRAVVRGLAHEIKNPLGGVRGAAQLLARELPQGHLQEYTDIIIREADRLRDLVDKLLGPNTEPQLIPMNMHEACEHVAQLLVAEAGERLTIHRDYDPSLPDIRADRAQLIQALLNVARNALEATEGPCNLTFATRAQRQLTIRGERHRLVLRLDIIDDGPGIPEELQSTLFVPMVSGRVDGSGLGLSIAQTIVSRHGGLITSDSEPGATRFSIYLPLEPEHDP